MNMNKEYRRELRQIIQLKAKAMRDLSAHCRTIDKAVTKLQRERNKSKGRVERQFAQWDKRAAILNGRLS